jgi:hypothetical protein
MAETFLSNAIVAIYNTGFFDIALPFIVIFAVVYGLLQRTALFGKEARKIHGIFALVVSLMVVPFALKTDYITFLSKFVFVIVKFIILIMILSLFGFQLGEKHRTMTYFLALFFIVAIVLTEFFDIASLSTLLTQQQNFLYFVIILFVFGVIVWLITGSSVTTEPRRVEKKKIPEPPKKKEEQQVPQGVIPIQLSEEQIEELMREHGKKRE